jgi:hypothetical protein
MHQINKLILIILIIIICGCAGPQMYIKDIPKEMVKPMGLFICTSSQIRNNIDSKTKNDIINLTTGYLLELLNNSFNIRLLNDVIPYDSAFTKYPGAFYINENLISRYSRNENCNSCLIVYYSFVGIRPIDDNLINSPEYFNILAHSNCSLYGWLVSSYNANIISSSHVRFSLFDSNNSDLKTITFKMFGTMLEK